MLCMYVFLVPINVKKSSDSQKTYLSIEYQTLSAPTVHATSRSAALGHAFCKTISISLPYIFNALSINLPFLYSVKPQLEIEFLLLVEYLKRNEGIRVEKNK